MKRRVYVEDGKMCVELNFTDNKLIIYVWNDEDKKPPRKVEVNVGDDFNYGSEKEIHFQCVPVDPKKQKRKDWEWTSKEVM